MQSEEEFNRTSGDGRPVIATTGAEPGAGDTFGPSDPLLAPVDDPFITSPVAEESTDQHVAENASFATPATEEAREEFVKANTVEEPAGDIDLDPVASESLPVEPATPEVVEEKMAAEEASISTFDPNPVALPPIRVMTTGTKLQFGSTTVELAGDAAFTYPEAENEQHFAATCQMTGNYEINARYLENEYDHNGAVIEADPPAKGEDGE